MNTALTREGALEALKKYNKEPFHTFHILTVEGVMRWFAQDRGHGEETDFWGTTDLLHDIGFEMCPGQHCVKAPEPLKEAGAGDELIHVVCSHGYGLVSDVKPEHQTEGVLFASDELTDLTGAAARMRPSGNIIDMEVPSLKKKFKDKRFTAGCSRDVIREGVEELDWTLEGLMDKTIQAIRSCRVTVSKEVKLYGA